MSKRALLAMGYHSRSGCQLTVDDTRTLKSSVFSILQKYPELEPLTICRHLQIPHKEHGRTVANYKTEWKHHFRNGLPSSCPTVPSSQHRWRAVGYVPACLDRKQFPDVTRQALACGWVESRNRNRELLWLKDKNSLGRGRWWSTGQVQFLIRKPHSLARAKNLAARAFYNNGLIQDDKIASEFLDSVHFYGSDDVWKTPHGEKLPYLKITAYRHFFGDIVIGDISHPDGVECQVCPQLIERMSLLQRQSNQILDLALGAVQQDSKERIQLAEIIKQSTEQTRTFSELMNDLTSPKAPTRQDREMVV